jgi:DNA processing protein
MTQELIFHIGLNQIKGVGPVNTKKIVAYCGGLEAVFKEKQSNLEKIPNVGPVLASQIKNSSVLSRAEEELVFIRKNNIKCLSYWGDNYPQKLKHCKDAPTLLFSKGNVNFENPKIISVVGTRNATSYGSSFCKEFIQELAPYSPLIVSGVAYGIDKFAHKESLKNNLQTLGILAHGLDTIYPKLNRDLASKMLDNGGLLTEFVSQTKIVRENFVRRNRIIAGLSDATIVVESNIKGGAIITARMANSYNREVFAVAGRVNDKYSSGCHSLIKNNEAHLITSAQDLILNLGWDNVESPAQQSLFSCSPEENDLLNIISSHDGIHIDKIHSFSSLPFQKVNELLMKLELEGVISAKPGNIYFN